MAGRFWSVTDFSEAFGKSRQTVHNWIKDGVFPNAEPLGDGQTAAVVIPASDVEAWRQAEIRRLEAKIEDLKRVEVAAE